MPHDLLTHARAALARHFGYADFRPPQVPAVEAILARRDALIVLPTGGGKSVCFQVPALLFPRLTVVVSPLISLMDDQVQGLARRGIGATCLNSTLPPDEVATRLGRLRRGEARLVYVAPERLAAGTTSRTLAAIGVDLLAIDEAHCVSEWGQDFRPSYLKLAAIRRTLGDPQAVALTATATPRVRRDVARLLALRDPVTVVGGFDRPNLTFRVEPVAGDAERNQATLMHVRATKAPVVVYAATRRQVDQVTRLLVASGVNAVAYHAGLASEPRAAAQDAFMAGSARVIVATNAFGMGIDKPDVRLVLHYLLSGSLEDYYQEAGRAGRDGARSRCVLLFSAADRQVHDRMRHAGRVRPALVRSVWEALTAASGGTLAVPLDAAAVQRTVREPDRDEVQRAIRVLQDRGVLPVLPAAASFRARLLASPLRLECERTALSPGARELLEMVVSHDIAGGWASLDAHGLRGGLLDRAMRELESRQLAVFERPVPRVIVAPTPRSRVVIERLVHDLKKRHEVDRAKLSDMVGYAESSMCRRRYILQYFGDPIRHEAGCGTCDRCAPDP